MIGDDRVDRAIVAFVFALAIGAGGLGRAFPSRVVGAVVGLAIAVGLVVLWGERVRPRPTPLWALVETALVVGATLAPQTFLLPLILGVFTGFFLAHDMRLTPSLLLGIPVAAALWHPEKHWPSAPDVDAFWIAGAAFLALTAALLERDRLARRVGAPVPLVWTLVRLAFVAFWTLVVLNTKKDLQAGALFQAMGFATTGFSGKVFLVGVLVACLAIAGLVLRTKKSSKDL